MFVQLFCQNMVAGVESRINCSLDVCFRNFAGDFIIDWNDSTICHQRMAEETGFQLCWRNLISLGESQYLSGQDEF